MASQAEYIYNKPSNVENCKKWYQAAFHNNMGDWWPINKAFKWRDDDVIVCTFPRSGTHLMTNMAMMITSQDVQKTLAYPTEHTGVSMLTFKDDQVGRRVLATHAVPADLGDDATLNGNRKFINVIRNPKAACASFYFLLKELPTICRDPGSHDSFIEGYAKGVPTVVDHDWVTMARAWEEYIDRHPAAPIMQIYFHEIIEDMEGTVRKVSDFLDVKLSEDKIKEIVEGCRFENMKKGAVGELLQNLCKDGKGPETYRKGTLNDWKNHFTVALNEMFDSEISRRMQGSKTRIGK